MDLPARKRALRAQLAAQRTDVSPESAHEAGLAVWAQLQSTSEFKASQRVALFASLPDELDTRPVFEAVRESGRTCLLPRCLPGNGLAFFPVEHFDDLIPGRYGVREPSGEGEAARFRYGDLALIPGMAFDDAGRRLGRGGGYYDRSFAARDFRSPVRIGVAWQWQRIAEVPADETDLRVTAVVTEQSLVRCAS